MMTDEEKFLRVLDDYAHATIDIDTAGSVEGVNEASQRREVIKKMLLDLYRKQNDADQISVSRDDLRAALALANYWIDPFDVASDQLDPIERLRATIA